MTKDEALTAIENEARSPAGWSRFYGVVSEILDQIDQPQAEFTVRELVELLGNKNSEACMVQINHGLAWWIYGDKNSYRGVGVADLKARLTQLANPQPPSDKVMVMMERKDAEWLAGDTSSLSVACREALRGTQP